MGKVKHSASTGKILHNAGGKIVDDCGAPCDSCLEDTTPTTKTAIIAGVTDGACACSGVNGAKILTASATPCRLIFDAEDFCDDKALNIQLEFNATTIDFFLNIGALTGQVHFQRIPSTTPYDCASEANGTYTMVSNTSGQCDFTSMTVSIA